MKIVILGSTRHEPYEIIFVPQTDPHGLGSAQKKCQQAIDQADEVWVYQLGMGIHTALDIEYAASKGKPVKVVK